MDTDLNLDIKVYLNICLQIPLDTEVMELSLTPKRTSRRQVARTAEDMELLEAVAALAASAALAAASADQEAADGPADLEVQEGMADQEEDLADSAGRVAQVGRMAVIQEDLEVQDTQVERLEVVLEGQVADRRPLPRRTARAPPQQRTEHHET